MDRIVGKILPYYCTNDLPLDYGPIKHVDYKCFEDFGNENNNVLYSGIFQTLPKIPS